MTQRFRHLLPVVLGGDIGAYALARQLHEVTGTSVTVVASDPIVAISESAYITVVHQEAGAPPERTIALLRELVEGRGPRSAVLMANTDAAAAMISAHRSELEPTYVLPFPDIDVLDAVSDKASFSRLCAEVGVLTPREVVVDLADPDCEPPTSAGELGMEFPLVAKAAIGADYDRIFFPGKRKIWFIDDAAELAGMWGSLKEAGYRSTFLVQECIPGDDTAMRSVTAYMDSTGELRLIGSARVLLQDHAPTMIGNPVAMITEAFPDLWEATGRLLRHAGYRGFATLDIKVDPRDGRELFFEVNPRIGRNNWYMAAAGANPMIPMVADLIDGQECEQVQAKDEILYTLVPDSLLLHYITDPELRKRVKRIIREGRRFDLLLNPTEKDLRRNLTVWLQKQNHRRKFARYYPEPTETSY